MNLFDSETCSGIFDNKLIEARIKSFCDEKL